MSAPLPSSGAVSSSALRVGLESAVASSRALPVEAPVAVEFNGICYAVMMATPDDLEDFAFGFALCERIVETPDQIRGVRTQDTESGWRLMIDIDPARMPALASRVRNRASESSCGICGLETLEQVNRPLPAISAPLRTQPGAIFRALSLLAERQPLNAQTGGVHAAAFCTPEDGTITACREDVGRHNALDKLVGALTRQGLSPADGFMLVSSRCSYELVEKAAQAGCPLLVAISTATSLAVARAEAAGLGLIALARPDSMLALTTPAKSILNAES